MRNMFPTFEEIHEGYCVYDVQGRYKGVDDDGDGAPRFSKPRKLNVTINGSICTWDTYLKIQILLNRKYEREFFVFGKGKGLYCYRFKYSKQGYEKMIDCILGILTFDIERITSLVSDAKRLKEKF